MAPGSVTLDGSVVGSPVSAEMQDYMMTRNVKTGEIPLRKLWDAWQQTKSFRDIKGTTPSDIFWEERGPSNVGGRTRSIMFDPNDPAHKKVWAGSVSGGTSWKKIRGIHDDHHMIVSRPGFNNEMAFGNDGAYYHISQTNPDHMITARQWNNYYRSKNGGESYRFLGSGLVRSWLIPPAVYDDAADVLYSSYNADSLLRVRNYMGDYQFEYLTGMNLGGTSSAFALSPFASNLLTIGTQYGRIFRLENANIISDWNLYEVNTAAPGRRMC